MTIPKETLMAYVDGELPPEEAARIEAEIAREPDSKAFVEKQFALRSALHEGLAEVLGAPVPERLITATKAKPSLRWRMAETLRNLGARRIAILSGIPAAAALATGLVIGVFVTGPAGNIVPANGGLVARGALAAALSNQLAFNQQNAATKIGISFRDKQGHYCRTFTASETAGVACHGDGAWHIAALTQSGPETGANAAYGTAASAMPEAIRGTVRGMIAGAPLDAAGERQARDQGWNSR